MTEIDTQVTKVDERSIVIPNSPLDSIKVEEIGDFFKYAGQEGYTLKSALGQTSTRGSQRDPFTVNLAVKITLEKKS